MTPTCGKLKSNTRGFTEGSTSMFRSSHMPASVIAAKVACRAGFFLVVQFIRPKNGITKTKKSTVHDHGRNCGSRRRNTNGVSSLRFPYQITRNCDQNE